MGADVTASPTEPHDRRMRDMSCVWAAYVPQTVIMMRVPVGETAADPARGGRARRHRRGGQRPAVSRFARGHRRESEVHIVGAVRTVGPE